MNVLLFIIMVLISFVVVRIGAIAFQLTGLEWSLAKFQALSCFTGTGFTTKEAELIVGNPQRRRIASVLMVLGNVGLVTLIATFANSLRPSMLVSKFTLPFLPLVLPSSLLPWANLLIIIIAVSVIYKVFSQAAFVRNLTAKLKEQLIRKEIIEQVSFEELLISTGGYGISKVEVCPSSTIIDKTLAQGDLRRYDITVLAIERQGEIIPNPKADTLILSKDKLICFDRLEHIREKVCPVK